MIDNKQTEKEMIKIWKVVIDEADPIKQEVYSWKIQEGEVFSELKGMVINSRSNFLTEAEAIEERTHRNKFDVVEK